MEYLTALSAARDAFSQAAPSPQQVGKGHVAMGEHGVYAAQQQLELVAERTLVDKAHHATLSVLDFYDVVVAGHDSDSRDYLRAWRSARQSRTALIEEMRKALQRT
ncbi:hypothetical protein [Streptomyces sp. CMB-StM0423]|uniref:hypothetical protein n=1 Tax=Streptomyces sp. CMB-StM0423 TaxID=2059884 RepID=UPI001F281408|nr:hypothetical protein [Streptomyces sp. CMB-StM0423]